MAEMMKQLTLSVFALVLGVAVLATNAEPALADRYKTRGIESPSPYANKTKTVKRQKAAKKKRTDKRGFQYNLDFETEAVWRNRRPALFID